MHFVCYSCYPVIVVQLLSGMFAVHNVMSGPAPVRKLVFVFLQESESLSKLYCSGHVHLTSGGSLQLEPTGINYHYYIICPYNAGQGIGKATQAVMYVLLLHFSIML